MFLSRLLPLLPNILSALPIICVFFIDLVVAENSIVYRELIKDYSLFIPFVLPFGAVYLNNSLWNNKRVLMGLICFSTSILFYTFFFNSSISLISFIVHALFVQFTRILFYLKENKALHIIFLFIPLGIVLNIIFKNPFFSSYLFCLLSIVLMIIFLKNIKHTYSKKTLINDLITIGAVFGSSFGYGLYQSIDKIISYKDPVVFYFFYLLSMTIAYFQNTFLLNENHFFFSKNVLLKTSILVFILSLVIPSEIVKIVGCYLLLLLNSKIHAILERKKLFYKSLTWLIAGIILIGFALFNATIKLFLTFSIILIYNILHSNLSLNKAPQ